MADEPAAKRARVEHVDYLSSFFDNALTSEIQRAVVNQKGNACPMAVRLAWHAAGTFDASDSSGGTDGASMRFAPESTDGANAGLGIMQDMLKPVKRAFDHVSNADIWARAGAHAIEYAGGPSIVCKFGRSDAADASACPPNGRLPDASQGAQHLRDVFYRMGFNDQEIVALSGAHTLGRCHKTRSGFDGPWTANPLKFDNTYFVNLMTLEWTPREWDGPLQYEDPAKKYMMLPTDLALKNDEAFRPHAQRYADDEAAFFADFSAAFSKLIALGCPAHCQPDAPAAESKTSETDTANGEFRDHAMHGSLERMKEIAAASTVDAGATEPNSGRTALHKACYWGHHHIATYLTEEKKVDVDAQDVEGDTALHDAARFGHADVCRVLVGAGADVSILNEKGQSAAAVATQQGKDEVADLLSRK